MEKHAIPILRYTSENGPSGYYLNTTGEAPQCNALGAKCFLTLTRPKARIEILSLLNSIGYYRLDRIEKKACHRTRI